MPAPRSPISKILPSTPNPLHMFSFTKRTCQPRVVLLLLALWILLRVLVRTPQPFCVFTMRRNVMISTARQVFLFLFFSFFVFSPQRNDFFPLAFLFFRATHSFADCVCAPVAQKTRIIVCKTIASSYQRLYKCSIHPFRCDWMLQ